MKLTAKLRCSKVRYVEPVMSPALLNSGAIYCWEVKSVNIKTITVACVTSVSVQFRSKERGKRVKDRAKNGLSERAGRAWGRKEGNFLPSPSPPPTFIFWLLSHFSRGQNRKSRSSVSLYSETKRKRLLRRLLLLRLINVVAWKIVLATDTSRFRTYNFVLRQTAERHRPIRKFGKPSRIWNLESGKILLVESRIRENFACGIQHKESRIPLTIPEPRIQVSLTKSGIQFLESGIHGVESRIKTILDSLWGERQPEHCFLVKPVLRDCYTRYFFVWSQRQWHPYGRYWK